MNTAHKTVWLVTTAALAAWPSIASAQIVNTLHQARDAPEGFSGRVAGSGKWLSGNTEQLELDASAILRVRHERHLVMLLGSAALGIRGDGDRFLDKEMGHLRYRVDLYRPLQAEAFVQVDRNPFRRRVVRSVFGLGPRVEIFEGPVLFGAVGVAYMPEYEEIGDSDPQEADGPAPAAAGSGRRQHRISSYLNTAVQLHPRLRLGHTLYLQPAIDDWRDLRAFSDLGFEVTIWKGLSLVLSHSLQLDTRPPLEVRPVDSDRRLSLALSF